MAGGKQTVENGLVEAVEEGALSLSPEELRDEILALFPVMERCFQLVTRDSLVTGLKGRNLKVSPLQVAHVLHQLCREGLIEQQVGTVPVVGGSNGGNTGIELSYRLVADGDE